MIEFLLHIIFGLIGGAGFFSWLIFRKTHKRRAWYGTLAFILGSAYLVSLDFWRWDVRQFFTSLGNWQSIFSSGTATLSAILYLASHLKPQWRKAILQSFLVIFKIIWVGFGLFVISEFGILLDDIVAVKNLGSFAPFVFSQILVAIIMLNGVYIGKRIGFGLVMLLKMEPVPEPGAALAKRIAVSGSISIVSWYGLLASQKGLLDGYSLMQLLLFYVLAIFVAIVANIIFESGRGKYTGATAQSLAPPPIP